MSSKNEVKISDALGRYIVASKDLKAGEKILSDEPFILGPNCDTSLVCFDCYLPLISKFVVCKSCSVAPICPGDGCSGTLFKKWHSTIECDLFKNLKLTKALSPMVMVQNVGSLLCLRALLKRESDLKGWEEFMKLETHLEERKSSRIWDFYENTVKFIQSLHLLNEQDIQNNLVQKIWAAIDVNSFEVRGVPVPAIGYMETLRGVYLKAALLAHDCVANTHMSINYNNLLVCHASVDIKKGEPIYYNYTDPLKGTSVRQQHLLIGKYFKCTCRRCTDPSELKTYMSSVLCPNCKSGYVSRTAADEWICKDCAKCYIDNDIAPKVQCCLEKFNVINKTDDKQLEEYIRNVKLVLAPNHYLLLDAKQRLAGVLRDMINREPHPTKRLLRRKLELCNEILPVLEILCPGISRTKAITLYEMHSATVLLSKKMFTARELSANAYMDKLQNAEMLLKRSLQMLFIEPGNSPEGELCAKALEEYKDLKATMYKVLDSIYAEGKTYVIATEPIDSENLKSNTVTNNKNEFKTCEL